MKKLYLGRPINLFGDPKDQLLIGAVQERFSEYKIEDPNQQTHQEGYKRYSEIGRGMDYYKEKVLPFMDTGVFLPFEDKMIGKGVFTEAEFLKEAGKNVFEVQFDWKKSGRLYVFHWSSDESRCLSVEETRERIYIAGKKENGMRSYFTKSS